MERNHGELNGHEPWPRMLSFRWLKRFMHAAFLSALVCLLMFTLWVFHDFSKAETIAATTGILSPKIPGKQIRPNNSTTLSPQQLMARPLSSDRAHVPKLLHQSWKTSKIPDDFEAWSQSCRSMNPDWEYVLWTDNDNAAMIDKYAPWFRTTYQGLQEPIERADASRNLYMHIFGGVYLDLDTECLRPYDSLFADHGVSTTSSLPNATSSIEGADRNPQRKAFLGQMHEDKMFHSGLPNAWMASTPAHPFWILPLEYISAHSWDWKTAEFLTGPDALFEVVQAYKHMYANESSAELDKYYMQSVWGEIHGAHPDGNLTSPQSLEVLEPLLIFPFSWANVSTRPFCWGGGSSFGTDACKDLLQVKERGSYSISYFSHSWDGDPFYGKKSKR